MFVRMLKLPPEVRERYDVSSMRVAIHAAAPCPVDVKRAMIAWWGPVIHEYYADPETGELLPAGRVGTVYFERRDGPLFTYHNDPENTRASRHPEHDDWGTT